MKADSKSKWPTLEGRLNSGFSSELEVLEQLEKTIPLSEYGKKRLKKLKKSLDKSSKKS